MKRLAPTQAVVPAGAFLCVVGYRVLTQDLESPWWRATPSLAIAATYLSPG